VTEPATNLEQMPTVDLLAYRAEWGDHKKLASTAIANVDDVLDRRYHDEGAAALKATGKLKGTKTYTTSDGFIAKADRTETVKWDGAKLAQTASKMDWPTVQKVFKITFSVTETVYKGIIDDELKRSLDNARTTEMKALRVTVSEAAPKEDAVPLAGPAA